MLGFTFIRKKDTLIGFGLDLPPLLIMIIPKLIQPIALAKLSTVLKRTTGMFPFALASSYQNTRKSLQAIEITRFELASLLCPPIVEPMLQLARRLSNTSSIFSQSDQQAFFPILRYRQNQILPFSNEIIIYLIRLPY